MTRRSRWLALPAGIGLVLMMATSVFAYHHQVPRTITVSPSSGTMNCDQYYLVRATVLDQHGKPINHLTVTWSFAHSQSSHDKINPATSKTDEHGVAWTRVKLACTSGDRVIKATTDGIRGYAVVHVKLPRHHGGHQHGTFLGITADSLPNTSTLPADSSTTGQPTPAIPAVLALLAAAAIIARRLAFIRR